MRAHKIVTLATCLISLILLSACEQQAQTNQNNPARIAFEANVHDKDFGKYIIHINALTTDQLPTEVAQGYKISRSKNRAMLNVSIREKGDGSETPVTAGIKINAKNLTNQLKTLKLREIKESEPVAIYYIGEVPISNEEIMVFDLDITPTGTNTPILVSYRQQFFTQ